MADRPFSQVSDQEREERRRRRSESHSSSTYVAFLKNLADKGHLEPEVAQRAAVSVLCHLEQRLIGEEARQMETQLPRKLQELLTRCERHEGLPPRKFGRDELLREVAEELGMGPPEAERTTRAVLDTVAEQISTGEAEQVIGQLPKDLRDLWPAGLAR